MGEVDRGLAKQWRTDERERAAKLVEAERDASFDGAYVHSPETRSALTRLAEQIRNGTDAAGS